MLLSANEVLEKGLEAVGVNRSGKSKENQWEHFHKEYGSNPLDVAEIWFDICQGEHIDIKNKLKESEKSLNGFRKFLVAHHFLYHYPKNSHVLAHHFRMSERECRGKPLWTWVKRIADMASKKIKWDPDLDNPEKETFVVSVDGTDFKIWEPKHPTLNQDSTYCSHKMKHGAVKYEIAIAMFKSKVVWFKGPFKGGVHDMTMFREGLYQRIRDGKLVVADRGYGCEKDFPGMFSTPNPYDPKELANFKSRVRSRHEGFNGRIKDFCSMENTFRHGEKKHGIAFQAIVTILQCQMDNGAPLFDP